MRLTLMASILLVALASDAAGVLAQQTTANPNQNATQQPTPKPAPKKKPEEPIDPDTTAGVRGPGGTHTVRVLRKTKPVEGAHVVVKNTNGSLAATCFTSATGECQVTIGPDKYSIAATLKTDAASIDMAVDDATGPIVIKLHKIKPAESKPPADAPKQ